MRSNGVREDIHDLILDAAERLLARYGYRKTTMDDLAREAGIGKGTIYLYFRSKEEVALSATSRINHRLHERLRCIARSRQAPAHRLRQMLVARVLFRFDSVRDFTQSLGELFEAIRPAYQARREGLEQIEAGILAEVLVEGRLAGTFAFDDAVLTAQTLLLATSGLLPLSLSRCGVAERDDVEAKTERVADLLVSGLTRRQAEVPADSLPMPR